MDKPLVIYWFRQDLRLTDNPALSAAAEAGQVLPIYILDDINAGEHRMGAASRCWLHHSLQSLDVSLSGRLHCLQGDPLTILKQLIGQYQIQAVYWNRCYEPWRVARDKHIKAELQQREVEVYSFNGSLLWEPWQIKKSDGTPYRVFTPFYRKGCLGAASPRLPLPAPEALSCWSGERLGVLADLALLPNRDWHQTMMAHWSVGEAAAQQRLQQFIDEGLMQYKAGRNFPAKPYVSRLSPHLHFGELSPNQAWYAARAEGDNEQVNHFCSELGWREFSYSLLFQWPELATKNLQAKFDRFPWRADEDALLAWQRGQTGIPIVDAGMRELWHTGYMHNRVRMIVGSFLVKNLLLPWQLGERWFWDCLLDADHANNSASWQWVAGCGADAAPYFRIFNPVTQGQKFDAEGVYTRRWVPELAALPDKHLFNPWEAPDAVLQQAQVVLGQDYPQPIVDLKGSRERALAAFQSLKKGGN